MNGMEREGQREGKESWSLMPEGGWKEEAAELREAVGGRAREGGEVGSFFLLYFSYSVV